MVESTKIKKILTRLIMIKRGLWDSSRFFTEMFKSDAYIRKMMLSDGIDPDFISRENLIGNLKKYLPNRYNSNNAICNIVEYEEGMEISGCEIREVSGHKLVYVPMNGFTLEEFYSLVCAAKRQQIKLEGVENSSGDSYIDYYQPSKSGLRIGKDPNRSLAVTFPDGTRISERYATDTFHSAILKIGVSAVMSCNEKYQNVPLISRVRDTRYGRCQRDLGHGLLLMVSGSVKSKAELLKRINAKLHIGLVVEVFDP